MKDDRYDDFNPPERKNQGETEKEQELEEQLRYIEELAKESPHSLLRMGDAPFWKFRPHLDQLMGNVHEEVTQSLKRKRKS